MAGKSRGGANPRNESGRKVRPVKIVDLQPNQLVQTAGNQVLKVSTIYGPDEVTAQVVYPAPPRTTVRRHTAADVATWREPSEHMVARYERAWGHTG